MLDPEIRRYVERHQPPPASGDSVRGALLERLRKETRELPEGRMVFSRDSAALVALLVRAIGAKRALEIGTFTGFSSLTIALALPEDGRLVACDISKEWTAIARRYWREAGVEARIELELAPALDTLTKRLRAGEAGTFDFALIDADKASYLDYYEACLELLRPGGLIAIDNTLWSGQVADARIRDEDDRDTATIRALNRRIRDDRRVDAVLLTIGDGLTVVAKR